MSSLLTAGRNLHLGTSTAYPIHDLNHTLICEEALPPSRPLNCVHIIGKH
jgi:hypothetical protein